MMVFCNVLIMAILLFTSLLSSGRLRCIQTLIIDVLSNDHMDVAGTGCYMIRLLVTLALLHGHPDFGFLSDMISH